MTFQALLVSKDEEAIAVLQPILSGFGLNVQCCGYPEAMVRISEQKFDAVLVDFDDPHSAALLLQNVCTGRNGVLTVALLSDKAKVRNVFGAGANFVLYKPLSEEHAQSSLRAATALMKRERRRAFRVPLQVPILLEVQNGPEMEGILLDLSEDGMDVLAAQPLCPSAALSAHFQVMDGTAFDVRGEVAWANPNGQSGVRFIELSDKTRSSLRNWVAANAPELPPEDPQPVAHCKLTDLSLGACYVETDSPFPERSGIVLTLKANDQEVNAEGVVRVTHPEFGMGIEFAARTAEQRRQVESFIEFLASRPGTIPELLITPRALSMRDDSHASPDVEDPLLDLLRQHEAFSQEEFLHALHSQRRSEEVASS